ncbi:hypothetical protein ACRN9C_09945 [Shewanella frigidimarina]|uniref:hypothetical protein n=1 Tax=Shewanella frigidimarina TaxID=56812 RepID=UPI003D7B16D6
MENQDQNVGKENMLELRAKNEVQKIKLAEQSLDKNNSLKHSLNQILDNKIFERKLMLDNGDEPSQALMDEIDCVQQELDETELAIVNNQELLSCHYGSARQAINELRKYNPKKANELENSISLKAKNSSSISKNIRRI